MMSIYSASNKASVTMANTDLPDDILPHQQNLALVSQQGKVCVITSPTKNDDDLSNSTIFVGGIDSEVTDEDLRQCFTQFGEVIAVKIPPGKGCGFVQFVNRSDAEDAMRLSGSVIGKNTVRLSWSRIFRNKQWNGRQGYDGYGYAAGSPYGASSNGHGNHEQSVN